MPEAVATAAGLGRHRDLLQLRRPLPVPTDHPARRRAPAVAVRPFDPDPGAGDRSAWIRANNRAFAQHPDQGTETDATLAARLAEPWFDPSGFLVVDDPDRPGELAGSCWTKVHPATDHEPALGEIYVIGVDPSQQGSGLGVALVLAGLDHLAGLGLGTAVLFVEADNRPALALYDRLGFSVHARRRVYER
ncbi:MAG: mycothiol synthase [Actinobacteria bacterium]|nr:mycothiol synthase [Actinomycetota bacterium]